MEAAVRQSAKPAVVRHCSAGYKHFYLKDRKTIMLSVWISTVLVGSPNIDSTIYLIQSYIF